MRAEDLARLGFVVRPAMPGSKAPGDDATVEGLTAEQIESRRLVGDPDRYCVVVGRTDIGPRSGVIDVETDIDKATGEMVGEAALAAAGIDLPPGPWMETPSGSKHRLLRVDVPEGQEVAFGPGLLPKVDVPWQFLAVDDGRTWHDTHLPIPAAPEVLLSRVLRPKTVRAAAPASTYEGDGAGDPAAVALVERMIDRFKDLPWSGGGWNAAFRKAVHTAAGLTAAGKLDEAWATEAILSACQDPDEAMSVFHSSWKHGAADPMRLRVEGQAESDEPASQSVVTGLVTVTAHELKAKVFPPVRWVVPNLIPEGLTLIGGKPKVGKSWFSLDLGDAVASGGSFLGRDVEQGSVLYLALEDTERRLQDRLSKLGGAAEHMHMAVFAPRLPDLVPLLDEWAEAADTPRLVIIDTIGHIRPSRGERADQYASAYEDYTPLKHFSERHRLGLVLITHTRKNGSEGSSDPLDAVAGSMGQAGAADTVAVLEKTKLRGRGRDVSEFHLAVNFNPTTYRWTEGEGDGLTETERATLSMIIGAGAPVRASDVGESHHRRALKALKDRGLIAQVGERGPYVPAPQLVTGGES